MVHIARTDRRWRRRAFPLGAAALVAVLGVVGSPGYAVIGPGQTVSVTAAITVHGTPAYSPDGDLLVTSASVRPLDVSRAVQARFDGAVDIVVRRSAPDEGSRTQERAMASSRADAVAAALELTGASLEVDIDPGEVVGPSGGLVFALGIVELLGPEDLTAGRVIAGTGRIDAFGRVGTVYGVRYKVAAAERAGADVFLVPHVQVEEARDAARHVDVIGVRDLAHAVRVLRRG